MKRTWLLAGLTVSLSIFAAVLVSEIALHVLDLPREQVSHQGLFVEYDSVRGWRNGAGVTGVMSSDEYRRELHYNERSLRGPVVPYDKPAGVYRIVVVGDSFVDGYTEELGDRVGDLLEQSLNGTDADRPVQVISLGTGGYSTDQELVWIESEGLRYDPDLVVLAFYYNDIWYNGVNRYWRGGKPLFVWMADSLVLTNVPVPPPDTVSAGGSVLSRLNGWVRENSKIYWLMARVIQTQPRLYGLAVRMGLAEPSPELVFDANRGTVVAGEFSVFNPDPPPETQAAWRMTDALVGRMRDVSESAGAEFMAFLVPIRSRIYTASDDIRSNVSTSGPVDANAVDRRFGEMCHTLSLQCIDPVDAFIEAADSMMQTGDRLYYRYDWHWNRNGHALAARILADSIRPRVKAAAGG